jgi:hypothetical protein
MIDYLSLSCCGMMHGYDSLLLRSYCLDWSSLDVCAGVLNVQQYILHSYYLHGFVGPGSESKGS